MVLRMAETDLLPLVEMAQIGPGEIAAGVAAAVLVRGPFVPGVFLVFDRERAAAREEHPVRALRVGRTQSKRSTPRSTASRMSWI